MADPIRPFTESSLSSMKRKAPRLELGCGEGPQGQLGLGSRLKPSYR